MRIYYCWILGIVLGFWTSVVNAQLSDDFSDGDFTSNPEWTGSSTVFSVNGNGQLQLNDTDAGMSYLTTTASQSLSDVEWRIWVKQSFSGSANNHSRVYLASDLDALTFASGGTAGVMGYYLQLGSAGSSDAIELYRDDASGSPVVLASGTAGLISSSFEIRLKVTLDSNGNWTVLADPTGGELFVEEFTVNDNTYSTANYLGMGCLYTVSNATSFYFDDIYFGDPIADVEAPTVVQAVATSANAVDVAFSEDIDMATAQTATNYTVSGLGVVQSAVLDGSDATLVHLTVNGTLTENQTYDLTISNVEDLSGNVMTTSVHEISWVVVGNAANGDVLFNEIMADPSPAVALPEVEYVELFNKSESAFNLLGWEFVNSTTAKVLPSHVLSAAGHVILCDETSADMLADFGDVIGIPSFTALTNVGDSLTLVNNEGTVIDIVVYSSDWYNDADKDDGGWSLELINPYLVCSGASNWTASEHFDGGTPGAENSVFDSTPDETAPGIASVSTAGVAVTIVFSEPLDIGSLALDDFSISGGVVVEAFQVLSDGSSVELTIDLPLSPGSAYTVEVSEVMDCAGNAANGLTYVLNIGFSPQGGDLIINEFLPDPDENIPSPNAEYIELLNRSDFALDLLGIQISGGVLEVPYVVEAGGYVILYDPADEALFVPYPNAVAMEGFPGLTNSGTTLQLMDVDGVVLDELTYDLGWYHDPDKEDGGYSLELINPTDPCSDEDNWRASVASIGATPGAENSVYDSTPDTEAPQLSYVLVPGAQELEFVFAEWLTTDFTQVGFELFLSDGTNSGITALSIDAGSTVYQLAVSLSGPLQTGIVYEAQITGVSDCWGNASGTLTVPLALAENPEPGDLIINELLFDPPVGGADFIEIYNRSDKNISLAGWQFARMVGGIIADLNVLTEEPIVLFAGEHLAFSEDGDWVSAYYPFAAVDRIREVEGLPSMANSDGDVYLLTPGLEISDHVSYNADMHFGLIDDVEGVTLERIDPYGESIDSNNWHSAAAGEGYGTPGYRNSQYYTGMTGGEVSIEPEVFSPDNDGQADFVQVRFQFDQGGYVANIRILDSSGREIKVLAQNELLGTEGVFIWDGLDEARHKANTGIYIILFEVFNLDGDVRVFKETCVLGHQLN
ncbi:MAG: lamin tail domain-containing protein [Flavobacteriales bacterium]|nr:lamin tail domain-containing protein [Flavobacteriales bacterium]